MCCGTSMENLILEICVVLITDSKLIGYTDSDEVRSTDDMESTSGYAFFIGSRIFSCVLKKQDTVALSSAEVQYVSASLATY